MRRALGLLPKTVTFGQVGETAEVGKASQEGNQPGRGWCLLHQAEGCSAGPGGARSWGPVGPGRVVQAAWTSLSGCSAPLALGLSFPFYKVGGTREGGRSRGWTPSLGRSPCSHTGGGARDGRITVVLPCASEHPWAPPTWALAPACPSSRFCARFHRDLGRVGQGWGHRPGRVPRGPVAGGSWPRAARARGREGVSDRLHVALRGPGPFSRPLLGSHF